MNSLEIALTKINGKSVSLHSMSSNALESFISVMSSLKALATTIASNEDLTFSITEGSAQFALEAPPDTMNLIYEELDLAIRGESENKNVTTYLRSIQDQIKSEDYKYRFLYKRSNKQNINLDQKLLNSRRISLKRKRNQYDYKLQIVNGYLNQIGGNTPNYHFDYGGGSKITISCTVEEAKYINQHLYQNVQSLLLCKEWDDERKNEYAHKAIVDEELVKQIKTYLNLYNRESELVRKLTITHDFINEMFKIKLGQKIVYLLLLAFNDNNFHLSEIKTMLVISKPFQDTKEIGDARNALNDTYLEKKNKSKI